MNDSALRSEKFAPSICHSSLNQMEIQVIAKVRIFDKAYLKIDESLKINIIEEK